MLGLMGGALFCRTCSTFDALDTTYKLHSFIVFDATHKPLLFQVFVFALPHPTQRAVTRV